MLLGGVLPLKENFDPRFSLLFDLRKKCEWNIMLFHARVIAAIKLMLIEMVIVTFEKGV